ELESSDNASPALAVKVGVCYYLLGRYQQAATKLMAADGGAMAQFYLARTYLALENYSAAIGAFDAAASAGYDRDRCTLGKVEALRMKGTPQEALALLDTLSGAVEQTAEYLYQRGATIAKLGGNPQEVVALFERAVDTDPRHAGA